jgi:hypothetical protein
MTDIYQITDRELAESNEELIYEYMRRHEFRLAPMNSRTRDAMFDAMVDEEGITGGWFYRLNEDEDAIGPFDTWREAYEAAEKAEPEARN